MADHRLTTDDNPFDPFTQFDAWRAYDERLGYNTLSYLARVVVISDELSEADQDEAIEAAIDEIVKENITGRYIKVVSKSDA